MAKIRWRLSSGAVTFEVTYQEGPHPKLGGAGGYYDVHVESRPSPRLVADLLIGAPTALLAAPTSPEALLEIAQTAAHFVLADDPELPVQRVDGRLVIKAS